MRLKFLFIALFGLSACEATGPEQHGTNDISRSDRAAYELAAAGCRTATTPEQRINVCSAVIEAAPRIETDSQVRRKVLALAQMGRGLAYYRKGLTKLALDDLQETIQLTPEEANGYVLRSAIYERQRNFAAMIRDLDRAVEIAPDSAEILAVRAVGRSNLIFPPARKSGPLTTNREKAIYEKMLADISRSRDLDPNNPLPVRVLADSLLKQGDLNAAIATYSEVLEIDSNHVKAVSGRAAAYFLRGDHADAAQDYERAINLAPNNPDNYMKLGWIYAASPHDHVREGTRAIEMALQADRLSKGNKSFAYTYLLPAAFAEAGRFDEAAREMERVILQYRSSVVEGDDISVLRSLGLSIGARALLEQFRSDKPFRIEPAS